jgi:TolB-like protein/tRNA A-37 threonylcarbamoyl transferase component Bud32/Flp pilus assembly protein TadD
VEVEDLAAQLEASLGDAYHIVREIGGGGMSRVFQAEERAFGRAVVIKVLPPELVAELSIERFQRETQVAAQLRHPNIVPVFTAGQTGGGLLFFTMPFIEGESLRDRLRRETKLDLRSAVMITRDVADALDYAHRRGVLHRDIKPENILLEGTHAVVADFGIARAVHGETAGTTLTQVGMSVGTPSYMSPEQASAEREQDARADIYSLGCVFYEMLTGHPPYGGKSPLAIIIKHLGSPIPTLAEGGVTLPPEVDVIIARALAKAPEDRYAKSAEFAAAIASLIGLDDMAYRTPPTGGYPVVTLASMPGAGTRTTTGASTAIDSVGVMPFVNASGDPEAEYLTEGITDNITNRLARMPGVRVIPRSTMVRYKGQDDLAAIAALLKVRALVTGRVHRLGQTLVVKSELVDLERDRQLWGEEYRRPLNDILAIQDEMATEISDSLRLKLTAKDREALLQRHTDNPGAYQSYLRGRFHWNKRNRDGFLQAIEHFQAAIDTDARYALAYSGLADTWNVLGYYNLEPPMEVYPKATAASTRALEIDPDLAPAHASLGYTRLFFDRDWAGARAALRRAIDLDPHYPSAHQWYGWYHLVMERFGDMIAEMEIAQTLDPLSLIICNHLGYAYVLAGHHDLALKQFEVARELNPGYSLTYWHTGGLYLRQERYDEAAAEFRRATQLSEGRLFIGYEANALALAGRRDEASEAMTRLAATRKTSYASPLEFAMGFAGLGDLDATFEWLDRAFDERTSDLSRLKLLPWPAPIRSDRRFAALVQRLGLPST